MRRFTDSILKSIEQRNWYGALMMALSMPDICGRLETPEENVGPRYKRWFSQWLQDAFTAGGRVFLGPEECYALRCSYFHEGRSNMENQRARKALENFRFVYPDEHGNTMHLNLNGAVLNLQVDIFCRDVAAAVLAWDKAHCFNGGVLTRKMDLIAIKPIGMQIEL